MLCRTSMLRSGHSQPVSWISFYPVIGKRHKIFNYPKELTQNHPRVTVLWLSPAFTDTTSKSETKVGGADEGAF